MPWRADKRGRSVPCLGAGRPRFVYFFSRNLEAKSFSMAAWPDSSSLTALVSAAATLLCTTEEICRFRNFIRALYHIGWKLEMKGHS